MAKQYVVIKPFSLAGKEGIKRYDKGTVLERVSINIRDITLKDPNGYMVVLNTIVSHSYIEKIKQEQK